MKIVAYELGLQNVDKPFIIDFEVNARFTHVYQINKLKTDFGVDFRLIKAFFYRSMSEAY